MDNSLTIRQGARLTFTVQRASSDAISATFIAQLDDIVITDTVAYDADGIAAFQFDSPDTDYPGTYDYQVNENFSTGSPDIYPSTDGCFDDDCELPQLIICESLDTEGS